MGGSGDRVPCTCTADVNNGTDVHTRACDEVRGNFKGLVTPLIDGGCVSSVEDRVKLEGWKVLMVKPGQRIVCASLQSMAGDCETIVIEWLKPMIPDCGQHFNFELETWRFCTHARCLQLWRSI